MASVTELERVFRRYGIDYTRPGFYNDPTFVASQQRQQVLPENYAEYVAKRKYSAAYTARAHALIPQAADYLSRELVADGRPGACIDVCATLQRMLEQEEIWSYLAGGAVEIVFPKGSNLEPQYFFPFVHPDNPAKTGHMWLCAPPFVLVDISLAAQPWSRKEAKYIPSVILDETSAPATVEIDDLVEGELMDLLLGQGRVPTMDNISPRTRKLMQEFPPFRVEHQGLELKYATTGIFVMDGSLESMKNLCLRGKYPAQLYADFKAARQS